MDSIQGEIIERDDSKKWLEETMSKVNEIDNQIREIEKEKAEIWEGDANGERVLKAKAKILERQIEEALAKGDFKKEKSLEDEKLKLEDDYAVKEAGKRERSTQLDEELEKLKKIKQQITIMAGFNKNKVDGQKFHEMLFQICEWYDKTIEGYETLSMMSGIELPISAYKRRLTITDNEPEYAPGGNKKLFRRLRSIDLL